MMLAGRPFKLGWFVCALALAGCTKASNPEISVLSLALPALKPSASTPSPFDQSMEDQKYVLFSGECVSLVKGFELQFDDSAWIPVPASSTPANGEPDPAASGHSYDLDCGDGQFSFWIFQSQLSVWSTTYGLNLTSEGPSVLRVRGIGGILPTDPMVFLNDHSGNGGGSGAAPTLVATGFSFYLSHPKMGVGQCLRGGLNLKAGDEYSGVINGVDRLFHLSAHNLVNASHLVFYSDSGCEAPLTPDAAGSVVTMPSARSSVEFFYKAVAADSATAPTVVASTNGWNDSQTSISIAATPQAVAQIAFETNRESLGPDDCRELEFFFFDANGYPTTNLNGVTGTITWTLTGSNFAVVDNCTSRQPIPSKTMSDGAFRGRIGIKSSGTLVDASIALNASGWSVEMSNAVVLLNPSIVAHHARLVQLTPFAPVPMRADGECRGLQARLEDLDNNPTVNTSGAPLTVLIKMFSGSGAASFSRSPDCLTAVSPDSSGVLTLPIAAGDSTSSILYFKLGSAPNANPLFGFQAGLYQGHLSNPWVSGMELQIPLLTELSSRGLSASSLAIFRQARFATTGSVSMVSLGSPWGDGSSYAGSLTGFEPSITRFDADGGREIRQAAWVFSGAQSLGMGLGTSTMSGAAEGFTWALLFRIDDSNLTNAALIHVPYAASSQGLLINAQGRLAFGDCLLNSIDVRDGRWHSVVASRLAGSPMTCALSIDGTTNAVTANLTDTPVAVSGLIFGAARSTVFFDYLKGAIAEIVVDRQGLPLTSSGVAHQTLHDYLDQSYPHD